MANLRKLGKAFEEKAVSYLEENGFKVIETNFYTKFGEIDIIAREEEYLVFCEVKYRKKEDSGHPVEAVTVSKQKRIVKSSLYYMGIKGVSLNLPIRYDILAILNDDIILYKNAFEGFEL